MEYREFRPRKSLRSHVRLFWTMRAEPGAPGSGAERIPPDGCPEMVINRADPFQHLRDDGTSERQPRVLLVGQLSSAISIAPTGAIDLIGIRFDPGGLFALLRMPMHEFLDEGIALSDVESRLRDDLEDAAMGAGPEGPVVAIESVLARWLDRQGSRPGQGGLAGRAVALVDAGATTVGGISEAMGLNRRAIERLFRIEVGISPKVFVRIRRLQSLLKTLDAAGDRVNWVQTALAHGYSDQPHMIRDFRLLAGTTPERYLTQRTSLASCFEGSELSHSSNP